MSKENFIKGKQDASHHAGLHSTRMRLDSAMASLKAWRTERTQAHESGEDAPELCYPTEPDGHFQIPEDPYIQRLRSGVIFEAPEVKAMGVANREPLDDGTYDSSGEKI